LAYKGTGAFSHLIITEEMLTPEAALIDQEAAAHFASAEQLKLIADTRATANVIREEAIQSPGSEAMHMAHRQVVQEYRTLAEAYRETAEMYQGEAEILRDVDRQQGNIDRAAHKKISAAKDPAQVNEIIEQHRAEAEAMSIRAANTIYTGHAKWDKTVGIQLAGLHDLLSQPLAPIPFPPPLDPVPPVPGNPPAPAPASPSPGLVDDPRSRVGFGKNDGSGGPTSSAPAADNGLNPPPNAGQGPGKPSDAYDRARRGPEAGAEQVGTDGPGYSPTPVGGFPLSPGGFGGSGGGLPGGGGLGGGGLSSGPFSSLVGGLGSNPVSSGLGSGIPASASPMSNAASAAGLGNPSGAFTQGVSSGAAAVSSVGAVPPASTAAPSAAPVSGAGGPAVAGGGSPAGSVAAAGASGVHAAPAVSGAGVPAAVPAAMMPSTGMGAPGPAGTAALSSAGSATTSPAGGSAGAGSAAAAGGGAPGAGAGAALVPAAVVNPVPEVPRALRGLSDDAQWAALLTWELRHDCIERGFPVDWAVGVFRREGGMEKVVVSNEGSGYVPRGVFLPRETRLLVTDPVLDSAFRDQWFGCPDPARVLVEYGKLRAPGGWALVAAASSGPVDYLRMAGVEHPDRCTDERNPYERRTPQPLDPMHVHRLQLEHADLYERVNRVAKEGTQWQAETVVVPLAHELVSLARGIDDPAESVSGGEPSPRQRLLLAWSAIQSGALPNQEWWAAYRRAVGTQFVATASVVMSGGGSAPIEGWSVPYREQWRLSRALELLAGWAEQPMPLADMIYAAAAEPAVDVRSTIGAALRKVEDELEKR
jgi:hypothetical protein